MIIVEIKGGLGNQLFQYATGRSVAEKNQEKLLVDLSFFEEEKFCGIYRLDHFNLSIEGVATREEISLLKNKPTTSLFHKGLRKLPFPTPYNKKTHFIENACQIHNVQRIQTGRSGLYLEGWFAKWYYFKNIELQLKREIKAKPEYLSTDYPYFKQKIEEYNSVAIHVRLGDYLNNPYFSVPDPSYYFKAINLIKEYVDNATFFLFSDDITTAIKYFHLSDNIVAVSSKYLNEYYSTNDKDVEELQLMSLCKHNIIANSTYSWWGAWLNTNDKKIVIAPARWYNNNKAQKDYETGDFVPNNWIRL